MGLLKAQSTDGSLITCRSLAGITTVVTAQSLVLANFGLSAESQLELTIPMSLSQVRSKAQGTE
jgi:hypothetical protein